MATKEEVVKWMVDEVKSKPSLHQDKAVRTIKNEFGAEFTYKNSSGNLAINKDVLRDFNTETKDDVVWVRSDLRWRLRKPNDKAGRQQ